MKKMTLKLIFISIITLLISSIIPNIIWKLFGEGRPHQGMIDPGWILFAAILTVFVTVLLYSFFVNKMIVQRIKTLNTSTKKVIHGDYKITIKDKHKDELSELTQSFNDMTNALQNVEYINKNFIRNFSHEYKTPLATIKGYAELVQDEEGLSKDAKEYLDIIIDESKRLSTLSHHMLLISQVDYQMIIPKEDHINITEELRKVIQMKQVLFEEKNLSFDLDVEDIHILSNQSLIYHVFSNIIDNAIKYTYSNQTIKIVFDKAEQGIKMIFSNPTKVLDIDELQLFNMFYTNEINNKQSNGIGLSLVKKIIEKLGGHVEANLNKTIFSLKLYLPIKETTND